MKKIRSLGLLSLILLCLATGCKKEEMKAAAPLQEAWTKYVTDTVQAYTLDEEGNLYTYEFCYMGEMGESSEQYLRKYDVDGNRMYSKVLNNELGAYTNAIAVKDGIVYLAPNMWVGKDSCAVLYSYNPETEEVIKIKEFPYFEQVNRILAGEDRIYLLGVKDVETGRRSDVYSYGSEKIMYYVPSEDEIYTLGIPEPIDMCFDEVGNLMLYVHTEEGFCFQLYDDTRDAIKTVAKTNEYKMSNMTLGISGEEIVYQTESRGLVLSSLFDLGVESELYPDGSFWDNNLCCVNGRVACRTFNEEIIQFRLDEVKKENERIRYISAGYNMAEPYGCGYEMQRMTLDEDKFALKVMALDKDFDICLVDSAHSFSYNLKKNGVFYPLNDVPGVQEYLDSCFPYVREAATDEGGNIWMLPIEVNIPGYIMNADTVGDYGFTDDMSFEAYFLAQSALTEEEQCLTETPSVYFVRSFFRQYFMKHHTVDTELFRNVMTQFSTYWEDISPKEIAKEKEKLYCYVTAESMYHAYFALNFCDNKVVYSGPKLSKEGKNSGTCVFLAVNPNSDHLNTTLDYLASWVSYAMEKEEKPLFFMNRVVTDTYETSLYELYRKGEIGFTLDEEIYEGWDTVLEDISTLDAYIKETDRKLKVYLKE